MEVGVAYKFLFLFFLLTHQMDEVFVLFFSHQMDEFVVVVVFFPLQKLPFANQISRWVEILFSFQTSMSSPLPPPPPLDIRWCTPNIPMVDYQ